MYRASTRYYEDDNMSGKILYPIGNRAPDIQRDTLDIDTIVKITGILNWCDSPVSPLSIMNTEIPESFKEVHLFQQNLLNYNSSDEEKTKSIIEFIEKYPITGIREFEISVHVRPKLVKEYVELFLMFSNSIQKLSWVILHTTRYFSHFLEAKGKEYRTCASQLCAQRNDKGLQLAKMYTEIIHDSEFSKLNNETVDALLNDDVDYFVGLLSKNEDNNDDNNDYYDDYYNGDHNDLLLQTYIRASALYSAINCFKFLMLQKASLMSLIVYAIAGGNLEIIRLISQNDTEFDQFIHISLIYRQDEIYDWIMSTYRNDKSFNSNVLLMTETMSVRALWSLLQSNPKINAIELLRIASIDGMTDLCRELSTKSYISYEALESVIDDIVISNLICNMCDTIYNKILTFSFKKGNENLISMLIHDSKFNQYTLEENIIRHFPKIHEQIMNFSTNMDVPLLYNAYKHKHPFHQTVAFKLLQFCINLNDFSSTKDIITKYFESLEFEELKFVLVNCPIFSGILSHRMMELNHSEDTLKLIIKYCFTNNSDFRTIRFNRDYYSYNEDFRHYKNLINYFPEIGSKLSPPEMINHEYMINKESYSYKTQKINPVYLQITEENADQYVTCLSCFGDVFANIKNAPISKESFDLLLRHYVFLQGQSCSEILRVLLMPANRKHIDISELIKSEYNSIFIEKIEFTENEFQIVQSYDFMKDRLITNPKNAKYVTVDYLLNHKVIEYVRAAFPYITINEEVALKICKSKLKCKYYFLLVDNDTFLQYATTDVLVQFININNGCFAKVFKVLIQRQLNPDHTIFLCHEIEYSDESIELIKSLSNSIDANMLILMSIKLQHNIAPKGSELSDELTMQLFTSKYGDFITDTIKDYSISKKCLSIILHDHGSKLSLHQVQLLLELGAKIDIIINGSSTLGNLLKESQSYDIIEWLIDQKKVDLGYRLGTAAYFAKSEKICRKIFALTTINKEAHYYNPMYFRYNKKFYHRGDFITKLILNNCFSKINATNYKSIANGTDIVDIFFYICHVNPTANSTIQDVCRIDLIDNYSYHYGRVRNLLHSSSAEFKNIYSIIEGVDYIQKTEDISDLLYLATKFGNINIIRSLLDHGANINYVEGIFFVHSPALEAIRKNRSDILRLFIERGLDVNSIYSAEDLTLINACIEFNSRDCFDLVVHKCDLQHRVTQSPMDCALEQYSKGITYYATVLYNLIDKEVERIESATFCLFEAHLKTKCEYTFEGAKRTPNYSAFGGINFGDFHSSSDEIANTKVTQRNLLIQIEEESYFNDENYEKRLEKLLQRYHLPETEYGDDNMFFAQEALEYNPGQSILNANDISLLIAHNFYNARSYYDDDRYIYYDDDDDYY